jgi:hypothetical protein
LRRIGDRHDQGRPTEGAAISARRERLSRSDAARWHMATPENRMVIGALLLFDQRLTLESVEELARNKLLPHRRFRQHVVEAAHHFGRPRWRADSPFELRAHVRRVDQSASADAGTVVARASEAMSAPLPRDRSPWSFQPVADVVSVRDGAAPGARPPGGGDGAFPFLHRLPPAAAPAAPAQVPGRPGDRRRQLPVHTSPEASAAELRRCPPRTTAGDDGRTTPTAISATRAPGSRRGPSSSTGGAVRCWSRAHPGRLDVMGGISDYSGSLVLELPLAVATWVAVQAHDPPELIIESNDGRVKIPLEDIVPAAPLPTPRRTCA